MRTRARIDATHREIVDALEAAGCFVQSLASVGKGCPDLLVGYAGRWHVVEVKAPKGQLNVLQTRWRLRALESQVHVLKSVDDVQEFLVTQDMY